jgi:hypothetical protein
MSVETEIGLATLHQAIVADIAAKFPDMKTVEFDRDDTDRKPIPPSKLPACLLELPEFEPAPEDDMGTGQFPVHARFEAYLIIGFRTPAAKMEIRLVAASFAAWLHTRRWTNPADQAHKIPTGPALVTACERDEFHPALDNCEVWRVEWVQTIFLGENEFQHWTGTVPQAMVSTAPEIGPENESAYQPIGGQA